jgi:hypothetical protein
MKLLAQKSLKMELRLKSYVVLKFQGLVCKILGVRFKKNQNQGLDFNLWKTQGARCKFHGIYWIWDLFLNRKCRWIGCISPVDRWPGGGLWSRLR